MFHRFFARLRRLLGYVVSHTKHVHEFQQLFGSLREQIWITNLEKDQLFYVSPGYETLFGQPLEGISADPRRFLEAVHPDDREHVRLAQPDQLKGSYSEEYRVVRPDGSVRWVHS